MIHLRNIEFSLHYWTDAIYMFSVKLMQARGEREKSMSERRSEIKDDRRQFVAFFRPAQLSARRVWGSAQNRKERDETNDGRHFFPRSFSCASRSFRLLRLPNKRNKKWHQLDMFWLFICSFIHFFPPFLYYCFQTNRYPHSNILEHYESSLSLGAEDLAWVRALPRTQ